MVLNKIENYFEKKTEKIKKYYHIVLRIGIAILFLWFGFSQIINPDAWIGLMPNYVQSITPFSANTLILFNGIFEIIFATLLLLGLYTRTVSLLLSLHLFHIVTIVGYGAIGARDLALAIATLSIFLHGADEFCLDKLKVNNKPFNEKVSKNDEEVKEDIKIKEEKENK